MRRRNQPHRSLLLCLTRRERSELRDLRARISSVQRVLYGLIGRRDYILNRVPDHKIVKPSIPGSEPSDPKQPKLL